MVFSNRMAPISRLPLNAGLVMMRERIWCTTRYMPSSSVQASGCTPYSASALGVLPPLWSSAAMKPPSVLIFCVCCSVLFTELSSEMG